MNIAQIHSGREWGGGEYQVLELVSGLLDRKIEPLLFTPAEGQFLKRAGEQNLPVLPLPSGIGAVEQLAESISTKQIDLLHGHDSGSAALGSKVARRLGIPFVYTRRVASPLRRNPLSRRKYSLASIDAVIAISNTVKSVFAKSGYPEDRIHVVQSAVDIEKLANLEPDDEFIGSMKGADWIVGGIGTLSLKKNWAFMIEVAALMKDKGPGIHWVLLGDGDQRDSLQRLVADKGLGMCFHFIGFREDATRLMKSFDALFFPSVMEGASVTVREAMAMTVPVIAVDAPGTVESVAENGWVVDRNNPQQAAEAVMEVLTDRRKRITITELARQSACERFALSKMVDGTIEVYKKVLEEKDEG